MVIKRQLEKLVKKNNFLFFCLYFIVVISILLPVFLKGGYIFAVDMLWADKIKFLNIDGIYNDLPFYILLQALDFLFHSGLIQRLILLIILLSSGIGGYLLSQRFTKYEPVAFIGGLFYMINPYTYTRLALGHWKFLLGYSLVPFYVINLINLFFTKYKSRKELLLKIVYTAFLFAIITSISIHHVLLLLLFSIIPLLKVITSKERRRDIIKFTIYHLVTVAFNLYWLIPVLISSGQLSFISSDQLYFFSPVPDKKFGLTFNLLSLNGFWGENTVVNNLAKSYLGSFILLSFFLYFFVPIVIIRFRKFDKKLRVIIFSFLLITLLSFVLAHGVGGYFYKVYIFLFKYLPGFSGLRDSHKFLSVFIICIGVLNVVGLDFLLKFFQSKVMPSVICLVFTTLTIVLNLNFKTIVKSEWVVADYPQSWYQAREVIYENPASVKVVPQEAYLFVPFTHKHMGNPAFAFLEDKSVRIYQYFELYEYTDCDDPEKVTINCEIEEEQLSDENIEYMFVVDSDELELIPEGWEVVLEDEEAKTILLRKNI